MTNITLSMPEHYYKLMKKYNDIKWTEVMRNAVILKLRMLEDAKIKESVLKYAEDDWDDASKLFKF